MDAPIAPALRPTASERLVRWMSQRTDRLFAGLTPSSGASKLAWIAEALVEVTGARLAFVGEVQGDAWDKVQVLALHTRQGPASPFEYDLEGTPCDVVLTDGACVFPERVGSLFPEDRMLVDMGVDSYGGMAVVDEAGRPLGIVVVIDDPPWTGEQSALVAELLEIMLPPARLELVHRRAARDLELVVAAYSRPHDDVLDALVSALVNALRLRTAFVAVPDAASAERWLVVASVRDGRPLKPFSFEARQTPEPERLRSHQRCVVPTGASKLVSDDSFLAGFGADGYLTLPITSRSQECLGVLGLVHDRPLPPSLEHQPLLQVYLEQATAELERRNAAESHRAIERTLLEARRRESLGVLAGGIAHDFNNLLVGILANAEYVQRQVDEGELKQSAVDIARAANRAADLCRQMLAYAGKGKVTTQTFDLTSAVHEIGELLDAAIPKRHHVARRSSAVPLPVRGDPAQVQQVVMNLLKNASDAMAEAEGTIVLETSLETLSESQLQCSVVEPMPPGNYAVLRVVDTGAGMTPETRRRLFDPFFTTKAMGHGLGLSAVLGIVRGHRGALWVDSAEGQGATFTVAWPIADGQKASEAPALVARSPAPQPGLALVVDDEPLVRRVARRSLERAGFEVVEAATGREALDVLGQRPEVQVVVLDLSMPGMDGVDTFEAMRRAGHRQPVLVASGHAEAEVLSRFGPSQHLHLLTKPFDGPRLVNRVLQAISQRDPKERPR